MAADGPLIVVKIGGSTLGAGDTSFDDVVALQREGARPVVVHGGGPAITSWMARLGIEAEFVRGLRVTDDASLDVAVAVLAGLINKQLVAELQAAGARALGFCGADGGLLRGRVTQPELGRVAGELDVDAAVVGAVADAGYVPVVAPIAADAADPRRLLNVNADSAAGAVAAAVRADRLVFLTDVDGILDAEKRVIPAVAADGAAELIASGVVAGGMIPKLEACVEARRAGALASIVNGAKPGALRRCLSGDAPGTTVA